MSGKPEMTVDEARALWADRTYTDEGYLDAAVRLSKRYGGLDDEEERALDILLNDFVEVQLPALEAASWAMAGAWNDLAHHFVALAKGRPTSRTPGA